MRERLLRVVAEDGAIRVRVEEVDNARDARLVRPATVIAAEAHRALRLAMEAPPLREDLVAARVQAGELDRVLVRLCAARREERLGEVARGDLRDLSGERGLGL